jgi:hypothetical protein
MLGIGFASQLRRAALGLAFVLAALLNAAAEEAPQTVHNLMAEG